MSTADRIALVFLTLIAVILLAITATAICLAVFTDKDVGVFVSAIINLVSALVAALVGYMAGRASANGHNKQE